MIVANFMSNEDQLQSFMEDTSCSLPGVRRYILFIPRYNKADVQLIPLFCAINSSYFKWVIMIYRFSSRYRLTRECKDVANANALQTRDRNISYHHIEHLYGDIPERQISVKLINILIVSQKQRTLNNCSVSGKFQSILENM